MNGLGSKDEGPCKLCGMEFQPVEPGTVGTYKDVDPCLCPGGELLPDVVQACCGHGDGLPYVVISPGDPPGTYCDQARGPWICLRQEAALHFFEQHGVGPPWEGSLERGMD